MSRPSVSMGFDGSADDTPEDPESSKAPKDANKRGDERPVTEADFDQRKSEPDDPEHFKKVDEFFAKIARDEKEHMAHRLRQNTKTD